MHTFRNHIFLYLIIGLSFFLKPGLFAMPDSRSINKNWSFIKEDVSSMLETDRSKIAWEQVSIPHTWNYDDVVDEKPGYYRGTAWYRKTLPVDGSMQDKEIYLYFEGVNQVADVFVNGKIAGSHTGGYTGFSINVSDLILFGGDEKTSNEILVKVDNSYNENIPPLSADYTFYGGIYRDVHLIALSGTHFSFDEYGAREVFITTPEVSRNKAVVNVQGSLQNACSSEKKLEVISGIYNRKGELQYKKESKHKLSPGASSEFEHNFANFKNPELWTANDPYLYQLVSEIKDIETGEILDRIVNPLGLRFFRFDPDSGFYLNGEHLKLIGVNRHQDFEAYGNAIPEQINIKDIEMMKDMGINFLRTAHYPQDKKILELCDRYGIITSVEIPIVNRITESEDFYNNCLTMQKEMIRQNFNHPSVVIWAYMNEVLLRPRFKKGTERYTEYAKNITALAERLEDLTRNEDPYRYTMIPNHGAFSTYVDAKLTQIPMLVGWNLYQGWYGGELSGFGGFLDKHKRELPDKPLLVTEYGGGADPRLRSFQPKRFDFSVEYNNRLHQVYMDAIMKRPFVAVSMVWNFADFNSETRVDAVPNMNNKGLLAWDRVPKDTYFLYHAYLHKGPFIKIASSNWKLRSGMEDDYNAGVCTQPLEVYSNLDSVALYLDNRNIEKTNREGVVHSWSVPFRNGKNIIIAKAYKNGIEYHDILNVDFKLQDYYTNDDKNSFVDFSVSLGDKRYLIDEKVGLIWLPGKKYRENNWGNIGGKPYVMKNTSRQPYGSDIQVYGTEYDPVFQTKLEGIEQYRFDVPDGHYEIILHFAELNLLEAKEILPYNLDTQTNMPEFKHRSFNVYLNDSLFLKNLSTRSELIPGKAFSAKTAVFIQNDEGLVIDFEAIKGLPFLNGVQIRRIL